MPVRPSAFSRAPPVDGQPAGAAGRDAPVGCLPVAVSGAVVDDESPGPRGVKAGTETDTLAVPGDPGHPGRRRYRER